MQFFQPYLMMIDRGSETAKGGPPAGKMPHRCGPTVRIENRSLDLHRFTWRCKALAAVELARNQQEPHSDRSSTSLFLLAKTLQSRTAKANPSSIGPRAVGYEIYFLKMPRNLAEAAALGDEETGKPLACFKKPVLLQALQQPGLLSISLCREL